MIRIITRGICLNRICTTVKNHPHYNTPLEGPNRGRGIAVGFRSQAGGTGSSATLNVNSNGTVNLITGSIDLSGTRLSLAMQAAEILGINAEDINPSVVDTDSVGWTGGTGGSRITFDTGLAVISASYEIIKQMSQRAAILWEAKPEDIKFEKAMKRLENIVEELEKGELDIDKSLEIFEEGIRMSRICSKKLNEVEQRIEKLTRNDKGELLPELFPTEESNENGK